MEPVLIVDRDPRQTGTTLRGSSQRWSDDPVKLEKVKGWDFVRSQCPSTLYLVGPAVCLQLFSSKGKGYPSGRGHWTVDSGVT